MGIAARINNSIGTDSFKTFHPHVTKTTPAKTITIDTSCAYPKAKGQVAPA
jgi:hypothetical protein